MFKKKLARNNYANVNLTPIRKSPIQPTSRKKSLEDSIEAIKEENTVSTPYFSFAKISKKRNYISVAVSKSV